MTELGISNNSLFIDFYFICFWRENDVIEITEKIDFRLLR